MNGSKVSTFSRVTVPRFVYLCRTVVLLVLSVGYASSQTGGPDYDKYSVYKVPLPTKSQVDSFLRYAEQQNLDVWRAPPAQGESSADVMVAPREKTPFINKMAELGTTATVLIPNVQTVLNESVRTAVAMRSSFSSLADERFFRFREMEQMLLDLARQYPDVMNVTSIGKSFEGRDLLLVRISQGGESSATPGQRKPAIWVDAGIHAREWLAPSVTLQAIHKMITDPNEADMYRSLDWYFLPLFNPDGYEFTHTRNRMWRKTRSRHSGGRCTGVDANRNFGYYWKEVGASSNPCSETYAGPRAFSEPETRHVRDFLARNSDHIKAYITFHSYGEDNLAQEVNNAILGAGGPSYKIGSSTNVLYAAAGGSDDWAKGVANISLAYTVELPGYGYGFQLPPSFINNASRHVYEGLRTFANYVRQSSSAPSDSPPARPITTTITSPRPTRWPMRGQAAPSAGAQFSVPMYTYPTINWWPQQPLQIGRTDGYQYIPSGFSMPAISNPFYGEENTGNPGNPGMSRNTESAGYTGNPGNPGMGRNTESAGNTGNPENSGKRSATRNPGMSQAREITKAVHRQAPDPEITFPTGHTALYFQT